MRDKYWAKNKYGAMDPQKYLIDRFSTIAGKNLGNIEVNTVMEFINSSIGKKKKPKILEVACGPGRLSFEVENHIKESCIIATDINQNMLLFAQSDAKKRKSKIKFIKGDLYHLPFKKEKFDIIMGLRFSMHIPEFNKVIPELSRNLKKGGLLIFDIYNSESILWFNTLIYRKENGSFKQNEIISLAGKNGLRLYDKKGIWLLGETILRIIPPQFFFLLRWSLSPPFLDKFSTKILFCFKKI